MELKGQYEISATRKKVWEALNDPKVLQGAIPGIETLEKKSETEFGALLTAKVGPVKAKFKGVVTLSELNPPSSYKISGEGQGGVAGFARGACQVFLDEDNGITCLRYEADVQVGGKLAQIGSRMISGVAIKMADEFFSAFGGLVEEASELGDSTVTETSNNDQQDVFAVEDRKAIQPLVWISGLVVIAGVLVWYFS